MTTDPLVTFRDEEPGWLTGPADQEICVESEALGENHDHSAMPGALTAEHGPIRPGKCGKWSAVGVDKNGHHLAAPLLCGREWCPTCGHKGSRVHWQRISRQALKILCQEHTGYWTFTIPMHIRHRFLLPSSLKALRRYVIRLLRRELGPIHGFCRFHFAGDCRHGCLGRDPDCDCEGTGINGDLWNPHLNVIIDRGWLDVDVLDRIKEAYRRWLASYTDVEAPVVSCRYNYWSGYDRKTLRRKLEKALFYVMRPTFTRRALDNWSAQAGLDGELIWTNFRNCVEIGQWPKDYWKQKKNIPKVVLEFLEKKKMLWSMIFDQCILICPICGERMDLEFLCATRDRWKGIRGVHAIPIQEYRNAQAWMSVYIQ